MSSKHLSEQFALDLDGVTPESRWNLNQQAHADQWTEEALCLAWISGRNAMDWDWWRGLKSYERRQFLAYYQEGREGVERGRQMPVVGYYLARRDEGWTETVAMAKAWAPIIRRAFTERKPCPFMNMSQHYKVALDMAIDLAGIPEGCLAPSDARLEEE